MLTEVIHTRTVSGRLVALLALGAVLAVLVTHWSSLSFGMRADDYALVRPSSAQDVVRLDKDTSVLPGSTVDAGYRPLSTLYLATLFEVFAVHSTLMHAVSLALLALVLFLVAAFVARDHGGVAAGVSLIAWSVHPLLPGSTSATIANQVHLVVLVIVAAVLLRWQHARRDLRLIAWWRIFALAAIAVFVEEDAVMLLPALLLLQWVRAKTSGDVPVPNVAIIAGSVATVVGLAAIRLSVYPHFAIFDHSTHRSIGLMAKIAAYGPLRSAVLVVDNGAIVPTASIATLVLLLWGGWRAWRAPSSGGAALWTTGVILLVCFWLPLIFAHDMRSTRLHLEVMAAALMCAGSVLAVIEWRPRLGWLRPTALILVLAAAAQLAVIQRASLARFAPCGAEDLRIDQATATWPMATSDQLRWFDIKAAACAAGAYQPIERAMDAMQWGADERRVLWLRQDATSVTFSLTPRQDQFADADLQIIVDGAPHTARLRPGTITRITYRLPNTLRVPLRAGHLLDLRTDPGVTVPEAVEIRVQHGGEPR